MSGAAGWSGWSDSCTFAFSVDDVPARSEYHRVTVGSDSGGAGASGSATVMSRWCTTTSTTQVATKSPTSRTCPWNSSRYDPSRSATSRRSPRSVIATWAICPDGRAGVGGRDGAGEALVRPARLPGPGRRRGPVGREVGVGGPVGAGGEPGEHLDQAQVQVREDVRGKPAVTAAAGVQAGVVDVVEQRGQPVERVDERRARHVERVGRHSRSAPDRDAGCSPAAAISSATRISSVLTGVAIRCAAPRATISPLR